MNWDTESTSPQNAVASDPLTDKQRSESENSRFRSIYSPPPPRLRKNRGKKEERKKVGDVRKSERRYESFFYIPVVRVQSPSTLLLLQFIFYFEIVARSGPLVANLESRAWRQTGRKW